MGGKKNDLWQLVWNKPPDETLRATEKVERSTRPVLEYGRNSVIVVPGTSSKRRVHTRFRPHSFSSPSIPASRRILSPVGQDTRIDIRVKTKIIPHPYNCIARLEIYFKEVGPPSYGTGFFISKRCVITAGHCVYKDGRWAKSIRVIPAADHFKGIATPLGTVTSGWFGGMKGWVNEGEKPECDCGVIILSHDMSIGTGIGSMEYTRVPVEKQIEIPGYPIDRGLKLCSATGTIESVNPNDHLIYYTLDTNEGQSGGPVLVCDHGSHYAIGIHVGGAVGENNRAIAIDADAIDAFEDWKEVSIKSR